MTEEDTPMADPAADRPDEGGGVPGGEYLGMPRWVKMFGLIVIGLVVLGVAVLVVTTAIGLHTPPVPH